MSRTVTLELVGDDGSYWGALPAFEVGLPYWQEVGAIVDGARERYGIEVSVLRLLSTEPGLIRGGKVTYLGSSPTRPSVALTPSDVDLSVHPLRPDYARLGGPSRSLEWAASVLGEPFAARQLRTWNLSAIWRLELAAGPVWLKQVPSFFWHEGSVLSYLDQVYAWDDAGRMLLLDIPGEDLYGAGLEVRERIVAEMVAIQLRAANDLGLLLRAGVPDRRGCRLSGRLQTLIDEPWVQESLNEASAFGLPDTLVHGDLHPGNVRGTPPGKLTIIDWGDSFLGQPAFDIIRLTEDLDAPVAQRLTDFWASRWREAFPDSDPLASVQALRPVAALRNALVYADFLAQIEPSEHPYHAGDVPFWLAKARAFREHR